MSKDYLEHHGVPGMRWGVRNYQNKDGSLTAKGRQHYDVGDGRGGRNAFSLKAGYNRAMARAMDINANYYSKRNSKFAKNAAGIQRYGANRARKDAERMQLEANKKAQERLDKRSTPEYKAKVKKAAIIGGSVAAAALGAYGAYKLSQMKSGTPQGDYMVTLLQNGQVKVNTWNANGEWTSEGIYSQVNNWSKLFKDYEDMGYKRI